MKVWVIFYKEKYEKNKIEQVYDICVSEKIAKKRLKEIKEENDNLILRIEEWNVREN